MKKHEAEVSITFRHWLKANHLKFRSATFEMKSTRDKDIFNLKELKEEQINHALACKSPQGNLMRTVGTTGIADYIFMKKSQAYVVIHYPKLLVVIDINIIIKEKHNISSKRARQIATHIIDL